jgi:hypothetical protein
MLSCVLILPIDQVETGNAVGVAMGWGPNNFSVPLSADGYLPATHYGLHSWVEPWFKDLIESGEYPPQLAESDITEQQYQDMLAVLVYSFWDDYVGHWDAVLAEQGLEIADEEPEPEPEPEPELN